MKKDNMKIIGLIIRIIIISSISTSCTSYNLFFDDTNIIENQKIYDHQTYLTNYIDWKKDFDFHPKAFIIIVKSIYPKHKLKISTKEKTYQKGHFICNEKVVKVDPCGYFYVDNTSEIKIVIAKKTIIIPAYYYKKYKYITIESSYHIDDNNKYDILLNNYRLRRSYKHDKRVGNFHTDIK